MIKLFLLFLTSQVEVGSHETLIVPANPGCENKPDIYYYIEAGIVCLPTDLIYRNGFEDMPTLPDDGGGIDK